MEKIEKPKNCDECPIIKKEKNIIYCGALKSLQADPKDKIKMETMHKLCPLDWR